MPTAAKHSGRVCARRTTSRLDCAVTAGQIMASTPACRAVEGRVEIGGKVVDIEMRMGIDEAEPNGAGPGGRRWVFDRAHAFSLQAPAGAVGRR